MAEVKSYIRYILVGLISTLVTLTVTGAFEKNSKINNAASKTELSQGLILVKKESNDYTDDKLLDHEKIHTEQKTQLVQIQSDLTIIKNILMTN